MEFEDSFKELEEAVMADMRSIYSEKVIDHFLNPRNLGQIETPDGFGRVTGPCGDTMEIYLRVRGDRIINATFWTDGCGPSIACGSMVTELIKGKSITEALRVTQDEILNSLGGLPEESLHCAFLAADTLREAIRDYLALNKEPWKRAYRRD
jgi:nitrogen fixation NifU-like protein